MCDFSGTLVAWMDQELVEQEAVEVQRHLRECAICRAQVQQIERINGELRVYCEALTASPLAGKSTRWKVGLASGAAAAAVALMVLLIFSRSRVPVRESPISAGAASPIAALPASAPVRSAAEAQPKIPQIGKLSRQTHAIAPLSAQTHQTGRFASESLVQVAIPADEVLPPGAVPAGVMFIADISFAADGSAKQVRLEPRLVALGGRPTP